MLNILIQLQQSNQSDAHHTAKRYKIPVVQTTAVIFDITLPKIVKFWLAAVNIGQNSDWSPSSCDKFVIVLFAISVILKRSSEREKGKDTCRICEIYTEDAEIYCARIHDIYCDVNWWNVLKNDRRILLEISM